MGRRVMEQLSLTPSEYFARQCHVGASFMRPAEVPLRHQVGLDRIMWGTDYPHKEASYAVLRAEALRHAFAGVPARRGGAMLVTSMRPSSTASTSTPCVRSATASVRSSIASPPRSPPATCRSRPTKCPALAGLS